jgi:starch-binding outer membrane protein SusE/F
MIKKFASICLLVLVVLAACKKEETRVVFQGGTNPVLSANRTGTIPLASADSAAAALTVNWTNPNYKFSTGPSSQTVAYQIEIDTAGANFGSARKKIITVSGDLSKTFTQGELNGMLTNDMRLNTGRSYNIQMRVTSTVPGTSPLPSNVLNFSVTPYAPPPKVTPYTNEVFMVGNATPGGWSNPVPDPAQKLTQVSPTMYTITLPLVQGNSYLFLPQNGSWSRKYGFKGASNSNATDEGEFEREGGDFKVVGASGNYKVELDFQLGTFKLTRQ